MIDDQTLQRLENVGSLLREIAKRMEAIHAMPGQSPVRKPQLPAWVEAASNFMPWVGKEWEKTNQPTSMPKVETPPPTARFASNVFHIGSMQSPMAVSRPNLSRAEGLVEPSATPASATRSAETPRGEVGRPNTTPAPASPVGIFSPLFTDAGSPAQSTIPANRSIASASERTNGIRSPLSLFPTSWASLQRPPLPARPSTNPVFSFGQMVNHPSANFSAPFVAGKPNEPNTFQPSAPSNAVPNVSSVTGAANASRPILSILTAPGTSSPHVASPPNGAAQMANPVQESATEREHQGDSIRELVIAMRELIAALKTPKPAERPGLDEKGHFTPSLGTPPTASRLPTNVPATQPGGPSPIFNVLDAARGRALLGAMLGRGA